MRYFFGFLVCVALIVLVVIMVLRGFGGNDDAAKNKIALSDYASTNAVVQMTVDGPIVAETDHRAYRITVGRSQVTLEALKGYEYQTIENRFYGNNQESYYNLLHALEIAGFNRGDPESKSTDSRGVCAAQQRLIFKILNGASEVQDYWTTPCNGQGNFKGSREQVKQLFNRQVPRTDQNIITRLGI